MKNGVALVMMWSLVLIGGCSSKPRAFNPELAAAPPDPVAYEQSLATCQSETAPLVNKKGADQAAAGVGTAAVGGAAASGAAWGAAAAAGAAAVVAAPVAGLVWGFSRINRGKKESRLKLAMRECLARQGYTVTGWQKVKPKKS